MCRCEICLDLHDDASSLRRCRPLKTKMAQAQQMTLGMDACHQSGVCDWGRSVQAERRDDSGDAGHQTMMSPLCLLDPASCDSCHREIHDDASLVLFDHQCEVADRPPERMVRLCRRLAIRQTRWYP